MNATDRLIVKNLLQSMANSCLFHSEEFRAALKHFNITTTYSDQQVSDEAAALLGKEQNYFVDVFYPSRIEQHPHGERFWFATKTEADSFSARERMNGDQPVNDRVLAARETHARTLATNIEKAHAEALAFNAEVDEVAAADQWDEWANQHDSRKTEAQMIESDHAEALEMNEEFDIKASARAFKAEKVETAHAEALAMDQSRSETIRAVIAQALHVAANSFGHVIGEHEELVETLRNAGFADAARKVDAVFDEADASGTAPHNVIRARWREALRRVSATF